MMDPYEIKEVDKNGKEKSLKHASTRTSWLSQRLKTADDMSEGGEENTFSEDCYSYIAQGCSKEKMLPFAYGMVVFAFQVTFLVLMICSKMVRTMSANEDVDNAQKDNSTYLFAQFIPANATIVVKVTQYVAILAFLLFAEDSVNDVVDGVRFLPLPFWTTDKIWVSLSCFFRFFQGLSACYTAWLLVLVSTDVIDIVLNFTAVNFISSLDDAAFEIASSGRYGHTLKKASEDISETVVDYDCLHHMKDIEVKTKDENGEEKIEYHDPKSTWYLPTIGVIGAMLLGFTIYINISQNSDTKWVAQVVRVEFDDESGLLEYSGCYDYVGRNSDRRPKYVSKKENGEAAELEYCQADRRWVFIEDGGNACGSNTVGKHLAQSSKTNAFDVTTAFELSWVSPFKKPLELYFIDSTEEAELFCSEFQADGTCNPNLNNKDFQWDGGDCCGMTCNHPLCNSERSATIFGVDVENAVHFSDCIDDELMDIEITLGAHNFEESSDNIWADFWDPTLKLVCGEEQLTVFYTPISQSMFGESQVFRLGYDADCDLQVHNFGPYFDSFGATFSEDQYISVDIPEESDIVVDVVVDNNIPSDLASMQGVTSLPFCK